MTVIALITLLITLYKLFNLYFNIEKPINFPPTIPIKTGNYRNWANALTVPNLWIAIPSNENDVVTLANWASQNKFKLRASGYMHNWSPLTVTKANSKQNVVLVKTTVHLKNIHPPTLISPSKYEVTIQAGASMFQLLAFLEEYGLGLYAAPAPGDLTIGGVLAIGGHGTGVPYEGEIIPPGHAYGTLSNLVTSFKAVVWDTTSHRFILKTFQRSDVEAKAFLVNFGRTFITEVTLMVGLNYNLRCESSSTITSDELFSQVPGPRTFSHFLKQSGRVEAIIFPFTKRPWLKVWTIAPVKPILSRHVTSPYNYPITENIPERVNALMRHIAEGNSGLTAKLGEIELAVVEKNLLTTASNDIWGLSKNLLLYVKPSTLKLSESGYAVITTRANVQKVLNTFHNYFKKLVDSYKQDGNYPINGPVVIRTTSLDKPDVVTNSDPPAFSVIHPVHGHPEYDTVMWINVLSMPGSPNVFEAMSQLESFMWNEYEGTYASIRPEWSKGWAYTKESAWSNTDVYRNSVPSTFLNNKDSQWNWAVRILNKYDPNRIFTNAFLDELLQTK